jgi:hypothetical protein
MTLMTNGDDILITMKTSGEDTLTAPATDGEDTLTTLFMTHNYLVTTPHDVTNTNVTTLMTSIIFIVPIIETK